MTGAVTRLRTAAAAVAAPGTEPDHLAAVVAWVARPGNHPDALRRRLLDAGRGVDTLFHTVTDDRPSAALAAMAGEPSAGAMPAAISALEAWQGRGVRVALIGDPGYPTRVAEGWPDSDAPAWLVWRGAAPADRPTVALVGARRASSYGTGVTAWLAEVVAAAGVHVVSGGAVGIDGAAHAAALERPGGTTVVLGCGHGVAYPRPHARPDGLFDRVLAAGGSIVSECLPDAPPRAHRIRARNRIVAALADAVVVVEGGARSGALLTASAAADRGRAVLAVPGDVRAPGSVAPHRLLVEGAAPCTEPADLLAAVGRPAQPSALGRASGIDDPVASPSVLPAAVHRVLVASWPRALRVEDLARRSGEPAGALLACLTRAKVAGEVAESHDGIRLRRAPTGGGGGGGGAPTDEGARTSRAEQVT